MPIKATSEEFPCLSVATKVPCCAACHYTSFILLSVFLPSKNGALVGKEDISTIRPCCIYERADFVALPALLMREKHKLMAEQFFTQPRQHFSIPFRANSTRFRSSSTPSLSHGIECCIFGSSLCEIMERASVVINVFENRSSNDWF